MDYEGTTATAAPIGSYPTESLDNEFMQKYPPDPFGEEMADNARVWKIYRDEATTHDKSMLDGWNKTLDILLIFAGLFSAVATAFVIESYKLLQPDYEEYVASAVFAALSARNGSGGGDTLPLARNLQDPSQFTPSNASLWLNGLWFMSLVLSLSVAFLCILLKQWLEEYNSRTSAPSESSHQWARRRTFFFDGMNSWHVPVLIAGLPTVLHLALFLFLAGLVVLLSTLDRSSTVWISSVAGCLFFFYVASTVLPIIRAECPSSTPLIPQIRAGWVEARRVVYRSILILFPVHDATVPSESWPQFMARQRPYQLCTRLARRIAGLFSYRTHQRAYYAISHRIHEWQRLKWELWSHTVWVLHHSTKARLRRLPAEPKLDPVLSTRRRDEVDVYALRWLIASCPLPQVALVGVQAIGALEPWSSVATLLRTDDTRSAIERCLKTVYQARKLPGPADRYGCTLADLARDLRSLICLYGPQAVDVMDNCARGLLEKTSLRGCVEYDLAILFGGLAYASRWSSWNSQTVTRRRALTLIKQCAVAPPDVLCQPHFLLHTALQLLGMATLPWGFRLHVIYVLPMQDVPVEAFIRITTPFRSKLNHAVCPIEILHKGRSCRVQCAIEILSELISRRDSLRLGPNATESLFQIVVRVVKDRRKLDLAGENFDLMPIQGSHFIALIASPVFSGHELSINELNGIANQLGEMIASFRCLPSAWTVSLVQSIASLLRAAICALSMPDGDLLEVANCVTLGITSMFNMVWGWSHIRIDDGMDISNLPIDLLRGGTDSAWSLLQTLQQAQTGQRRPPEIPMSQLSDLLAAALCYASRRGHDVSDQVNTFLGTGSHVDRFVSLAADTAQWAARDNVRGRFVVFVRHCNELRPDWSRTVLERAVEIKGLEYEARLRSFMAEIEEAAAEHGPCTECPGGVRDAAPSRWTWRIGRPRLTV